MFILKLETRFDGDTRFKVFCFNNLNNAKKKMEKLSKLYCKYNLAVIEKSKQKLFATDDIYDDYALIEINKIKTLD